MIWGENERMTSLAALAEAINDEYRAQASYASVLEAFGPAQPFVDIHQSEGRHIAALTPLFGKLGHPVPPDMWAGLVVPPPSLEEACRAGIAAEIANFRMYDRLIGIVNDPELIAVFSNLRQASSQRHLPAFQACLAAVSGTGMQGYAPQVARPRPGLSGESLLALGLGLLAGGGALWWFGQRNG